MESQVQTPLIPVQSKSQFPWLVLILSNLVSLLIGLTFAKFVFVPATIQPVQPIPTPTQVQEPVVSNWLVYQNPIYKFQFNYPPEFVSPIDGGGVNFVDNQNLVNLSSQEYKNTIRIDLDPQKFSLDYLRKYAPTGSENFAPQPKTFGTNTFYYYGPGGGGVNYADQYFYNLNGQILIFIFDGPYENDKTPSESTKQLANQILSTFKFNNPNVDNPNPSCSLKPKTGDCKASFRKFYYDTNEKKCKEFVWGGCGGVVPFQTLSECQTSCE